MGRGNFFEQRKTMKRAGIHPVWRGIGCVMLVLLPMMAYAGATLLVQADLSQGWYPVPAEMARPVNIPLLGSVPYLYANLTVAFVLLLIGYGLLVIVYSLIYRAAKPSRYGPYDAPPIRRRKRRR